MIQIRLSFFVLAFLCFTCVPILGTGCAVVSSVSSQNSPASDPLPVLLVEDDDDDEDVDDEEVAEPTKALPGPKVPFEIEEARATFEEGRASFVRGDWKAAAKSFRACKKHVAKEDKPLLESWILAVKGGKEIDKVRKDLSKDQARRAWARLQLLAPKYRETPLRFFLDLLEEGIRGELYTTLATFENRSSLDSEPVIDDTPSMFGSYNRRSEYVRSGEQSAQWRPATEKKYIVMLELAKLTGEQVESHQTFEFSVYNADERKHRFILILHIGDLSEISRNDGSLGRKPCFHTHVDFEPGWNEISIDLKKDLKMNGRTAKSQIQGAILVDIETRDPKTVYIDDVRLGRQ